MANAHSEERASCLYVKRILDFMRPASHCFSSVSNPSPPPPPPNNGIKSASEAIKHNVDRQTNGERFVDGRFYHRPQDPDDVEAATRAENALVSVREQIKEIGEANPVLRSILNGAIQELEEGVASKEEPTGRRLLVRRDYVHTLSGALSTHAVQSAVGVQGVPGVTQLSCEALCEAATRDLDTATAPTDACHAYAFRRDNPFSLTDLRGHCWLLQNAGACKSEVCFYVVSNIRPSSAPTHDAFTRSREPTRDGVSVSGTQQTQPTFGSEPGLLFERLSVREVSLVSVRECVTVFVSDGTQPSDVGWMLRGHCNGFVRECCEHTARAVYIKLVVRDRRDAHWLLEDDTDAFEVHYSRRVGCV